MRSSSGQFWPCRAFAAAAIALAWACAAGSAAAASPGAASAAAAKPAAPPPAATMPPPGHPASAASKKAPPPAPAKLVDINSASAKELKTLPGVDDALAKKIIANRPYYTKAELVTKGVMPEGPYLSLKGKVVAMQKGPPPKPPAKAASGAASAPAKTGNPK